MPYDKIVEYIEGINKFDKIEEYYSAAVDKKNSKKLIDTEIIKSGDTDRIMKYLKDNGENLSVYAINFLVHRVRMLNQFAEAEEKYSNTKSEPVKLITRTDGSVILDGVVPDRKQDTKNGCWSCTYSLMLKSRGVKLDQQVIRGYHRNEGKDELHDYEEDIDKDVPLNPTDKIDVLMKLVPNTAMKSVNPTISPEDYEQVADMQQGNQNIKFDQVRIKKDLRDKLETIFSEQINKSIRDDKSPVGFLIGNHFYTIVGLANDGKLLVYDSDDKTNTLSTKSLGECLEFAMPKNRVIVSLVALSDIRPKKNSEKVELTDEYKKFNLKESTGEIIPQTGDNVVVMPAFTGSKAYCTADEIKLPGEFRSSCSLTTYMPKKLNMSLMKKDIVAAPPRVEEPPEVEIAQPAPEQDIVEILQQEIGRPDGPVLGRRLQSNREFRQLYENLSAHADEVIQSVEASNIYNDVDKQEYLTKLRDYKGKVNSLVDCLEGRLDSHEPETKETKREMLDRSIEVRTALRGLRQVMPNQYKNATERLNTLDGIITGINPEDKLSLSTIANGTASSVYVINGNPDYMGARSNQRYMMKKKNADGTEVEGFFTIDKEMLKIRHTEQVERMVNEAKEAGEKNNNITLLDFIKNVEKSKYGLDSIVYAMQTDSKNEKAWEKAKKDLKNNKITKMPKTLKGYEPSVFDQLGITEDGTNLTTNHLKKNKDINNLLDRIRNTFTDAEIDSIRTERSQYSAESRIGIDASKGSTRAGRNYAMSKIADILGVSDLVAKSVPMKASINGRIYDGVFMEKAPGLAVPNTVEDILLSDFRKVNSDSFNGEVLGKLAAIQLLDYICGNIDRHQNNLLYTIKDGKITDVKAIDNDMSFGTKVFGENETAQSGVKLSHMMVAPKEMVDALNRVPFHTITGALSDTGLTEDEITAVGQRIMKFKEYLRKNPSQKEQPDRGTIKVVDKDGWNKLDFKQLSEDFGRGRKKINNTSVFNRVNIIPVNTKKARLIYTSDKEDIEKKLRNRYRENQKQIKKEYAVTDNTDTFKAVDIANNVAPLQKFISELSATENKLLHRTTETYDAMKAALVSLSETKHPEKMSVDDYRAFEQSIADVEQATSEYIRHKMDKRDTRKTGQTRLAKAKELRGFLEDYRKQVHEAGNLKEEEQVQEDYRKFLEEQEATNKKLDIITSVLTKAIVGDRQVENIKELEEKLREDKDFHKLMASRDGIDDEDKVSPVDYFGNMALENPEKLKKLYESIKLKKVFVENDQLEPSEIFEKNEKIYAEIKKGLTEEKSGLYSKVVQHYAMKDKIEVDTKEEQLKFYKKWYDEVAGKDKVSNYFEKETEAGMTDALYDRTLLKNLLQEEKQLRELYVSEGATFDKYKNLRKICGLKQSIAQHATKMYDETANVYERIASKYAYETFMEKYKGISYADIPVRELAIQKGVTKMLTKHLEENVDADIAAKFLSGKASLDDKLGIKKLIETYVASKGAMVDTLTGNYEKYDAKLEAEANQRAEEAKKKDLVAQGMNNRV